MTAPWRVHMNAASPAGSDSAVQFVVVHGMQVSDGHLSDLEVIASSNAATADERRTG